MVYYRVKPKYDNYGRNKRMKNGRLAYGGIFIGNELYTEKEYNNLIQQYQFRIPASELFERVEISKRRVYWFFGARFEMEA